MRQAGRFGGGAAYRLIITAATAPIGLADGRQPQRLRRRSRLCDGGLELAIVGEAVGTRRRQGAARAEPCSRAVGTLDEVLVLHSNRRHGVNV